MLFWHHAQHSCKWRRYHIFRQNDSVLRALNVALWENLVLEVALMLESRALKWKTWFHDSFSGNSKITRTPYDVRSRVRIPFHRANSDLFPSFKGLNRRSTRLHRSTGAKTTNNKIDGRLQSGFREYTSSGHSRLSNASRVLRFRESNLWPPPPLIHYHYFHYSGSVFFYKSYFVIVKLEIATG